MKSKSKPICFKLWTYFTIFAIIILTVLWLLQTVFLESFYNVLQQNHIEKIADKISDAGINRESVIDTVAAENSILILLTDNDGNILYSADEYSLSYNKKAFSDSEHGIEKNPYRAEHSEQSYRHLPEHYDEFIDKLGDNEKICYTRKHFTECIAK